MIQWLLLFASCLVSFLALAAFVELLFFFCKVQNYRLRASLRLLPILKLPFDLILFILVGKESIKNINPLSCEKSLQTYLLHYFSQSWLEVALFTVIGLSLWLTFRKVYHFYQETKHLQMICGSSSHLLSESLQNTLLQKQATIVITDQVDVPCAFARGYILFPKSMLSKLSSAEFEAVVAHEIEHLRHFDPFIKMGALLISRLFWWVPMKWWLKRVEREQEFACDWGTGRYRIEKLALATALYNVLGALKARPRETVRYFSNQLCIPLVRVQRLLHVSSHCPHSRWQALFISAVALASTLLFTFWIC